VVSKCDRSDSNRTLTDLKSMLTLGLTGRAKPEWVVPVIGTSAVSGEGLDELVAATGQHRAIAFGDGLGRKRRWAVAAFRLRKTAENLLLERFDRKITALGDPLAQRLARREADPYSLADELLRMPAQEGRDDEQLV